MPEIRINADIVAVLIILSYLSVMIWLYAISQELKANKYEQKKAIVYRENAKQLSISFDKGDTIFNYTIEAKK